MFFLRFFPPRRRRFFFTTSPPAEAVPSAGAGEPASEAGSDSGERVGMEGEVASLGRSVMAKNDLSPVAGPFRVDDLHRSRRVRPRLRG